LRIAKSPAFSRRLWSAGREVDTGARVPASAFMSPGAKIVAPLAEIAF
jgi:hypothetical protein